MVLATWLLRSHHKLVLEGRLLQALGRSGVVGAWRLGERLATRVEVEAGDLLALLGLDHALLQRAGSRHRIRRENIICPCEQRLVIILILIRAVFNLRTHHVLARAV